MTTCEYILLALIIGLAGWIKISSDRYYKDLEEEMRKEHYEKMKKALPEILKEFEKLKK